MNKRQLGGKDIEWITLSSLRSFAATTLFGKAGFEMTSKAVYDNDLPTRYDGQQVSEDEAKAEGVEVAGALFSKFGTQFAQQSHTLIGAPAVMAAIGVVGHRSMSWSQEPHQTVEQFVGLLSPVNWSRDPKTWHGITGKITESGTLSLAGGVKENGSKTATALQDESAESYHRIRTAA